MSKQGFKTRSLFILVSASIAGFVSHSHGAGFQLFEQSITGLGRSYAGGSLAADDASAVFYNPADMALLEGRHTQIGVAVYDTNSKFEGSYVSPFGGAGSGNTGTKGAASNFYYIHPSSNQLTYGFGLTVPFGLATKYDSSWLGRYEAIESELQVLDFNPSFSYKVSDNVSVGFGISAQKAEATLTSTMPGGSLVALALPTSPTDGNVKIEGDSWGWGFNAGVTWKLDDHSRMSFAYRSSVKHELKGERTISGLTGGGAPFVNGVEKAVADLKLPETASLNYWRDLQNKWQVMASIRFARWSSYKELRVSYDNPLVTDTVEPQNWDNTYSFSIGTSY